MTTAEESKKKNEIAWAHSQHDIECAKRMNEVFKFLQDSGRHDLSDIALGHHRYHTGMAGGVLMHELSSSTINMLLAFDAQDAGHECKLSKYLAMSYDELVAEFSRRAAERHAKAKPETAVAP